MDPAVDVVRRAIGMLQGLLVQYEDHPTPASPKSADEVSGSVRVRKILADGKWHDYEELITKTRSSRAAVASSLRDLNKHGCLIKRAKGTFPGRAGGCWTEFKLKETA